MTSTAKLTRVDAVAILAAGKAAGLAGDDFRACPYTPSGDATERLRVAAWMRGHTKGTTQAAAIAAAATPAGDTTMADDQDTPAEDRTGVIIVALPAADDPCQTIGAEDKHATLLFFGDSTDLPAEATADAIGTIVEGLASRATFDADVSGVESLGEDGARVWMLTSTDLGDLHTALAGDPTLSPWVIADQYPTYTAHVTIGYPDDHDGDAQDTPPVTAAADVTTDLGPLDDDTETAAAAVTSISFDRLAVWYAGEQHEYPLGAPAVTAAAGDPAPVPQPPDTAGAGDPAPVVDAGLMLEQESDQFYGVMVVEDSQTGDGRVFAANSIDWSTPNLLPMPLGWQVADAMGHDGSVVCGRVDTITRFGNLIGFTGTWDMVGAGYETHRLVEGRFLTGLSVDTDDCVGEVVTPDGVPLDGMDFLFTEPGDEPIWLVTSARIRSAAMCRVPAFTEAFVANGTPPPGWAGERPGTADPAAATDPADPATPTDDQTTTALVASARAANNPAATVRALPSIKLWDNPEFGETDADDPRLTLQPGTGVTETNEFGIDVEVPAVYGCPFTVDGDRVFGHLALWETCHIGYDGVCTVAPPSPSNYSVFYGGGCVETDAGLIRTGPLTMGTGHADLFANAAAAAAHYDNTGTAVCDVVMGQDVHGVWFSGRTRPGITEDQVYAMRATGKVSGDWRDFGGQHDLVAALVVNVPGFPITRTALAASGGRTVALVAAGVVNRPDDAAVIAGRGQLLTMADVQREVAATLRRVGRHSAALDRMAVQARAGRAARIAAASAKMEASDVERRRARLAASAARMGV